MTRRFAALVGALALTVTLAQARPALADARGVGLGVAAGVDMYQHQDIDLKTSFSWGFFVDIPLLNTFYITPAAMVYELSVGDAKVAATDIDLNFKFVIPLHPLSLGFGVTAGLTTGLGDYYGHYGALGYLGWNIVANLDLFAMVQYKRLTAHEFDYNNVHAYGGGMFRF